jgi:hypothetical protein
VAKARSAVEVIDQVIAENAGSAVLCYSLVVAFAASGLLVLAWGPYRGEGLTALAGSVAGGLFWPALSQARQVRDMNIAIRLLEIPLGKATTAEAAAETLQRFFESRFTGGRAP